MLKKYYLIIIIIIIIITNIIGTYYIRKQKQILVLNETSLTRSLTHSLLRTFSEGRTWGPQRCDAWLRLQQAGAMEEKHGAAELVLRGTWRPCP